MLVITLIAWFFVLIIAVAWLCSRFTVLPPSIEDDYEYNLLMRNLERNNKKKGTK